jgi:hypothetical protein
VLEPGIQAHKEHLLKLIFDSGLANIYIASGATNWSDLRWTESYCHGQIQFSYRESDLVQRVVEFCRRNRLTLDGVLTYVEPAVPYANLLQHKLGLPAISRRNSPVLRNKYFVRRLAQRIGVRQPWFAFANSAEELRKIVAAGIPYPIVMKPVEMMGSLAVRRIETEAELWEYFERCFGADFWNENLHAKYWGLEKGVICEELIDGPQYSVETLVGFGAPKVLGLTLKRTIEDDFFCTRMHVFPAPDVPEEVLSRVVGLIRATHRALEFQHTFTNTDIRLVGGEPCLIEINPRIAGDGITRAMDSYLEGRLGQWLAGSAVGARLDTTIVDRRSTPRRTVITYALTSVDGRVLSVPAGEPGPDGKMTSWVKAGSFVLRDQLCSHVRLGEVVSDRERCDASDGYLVQPAILVKRNSPRGRTVVVTATEADAAELHRVELEAWGAEMGASADVLVRRLKGNSSVTLVAFDALSGQALGFNTYVLLEAFDPNDVRPWRYYAGLAEDAGYCQALGTPRFLYGLTLGVSPAAPPGTASLLKEAALLYAARHEYICVVSCVRIPRFRRYAERGMTIDEYYDGVVRGQYREAAYWAARSSGAEPHGYIANYYDDPDSLNYAILLTNYVIKRRHASTDSGPARQEPGAVG